MVTTTIKTTTRFHATGWELAADIDRVDAAAAKGETACLTDNSALTVAAGWQSPGTQGQAFAELASTGSVSLHALADDIEQAWHLADTSYDRHMLDLLLIWAYHHPSLQEG